MTYLVLFWGWPQKAIFDTERPSGFEGPWILGKKPETRASLVAQWLRICLLMQGTRVRALVWEDPACRGVTRPVSHNS